MVPVNIGLDENQYFNKKSSSGQGESGSCGLPKLSRPFVRHMNFH